MFQQIVPRCKECKEVAIGTINCPACNKSILCEPCVVDGVKMCKKCLKGNGQPGKLSVNTTAKSILQAAKFKCPYQPHCAVTNIAYDDLEKHMTEDCDHRMQECPLMCGELVQVTNVDEHLLNDCSNQSLACPQCSAASCGQKDITRGTLTKHLVEKCTGHTVCKDCGGSYKLRINLSGRD